MTGVSRLAPTNPFVFCAATVAVPLLDLCHAQGSRFEFGACDKLERG